MPLVFRFRWLITLVFLLPALAGCVVQEKLPYLQNSQYSTTQPVVTANAPVPYKLQPSDILSVKVQSVQPELNQLFNINNSQGIFSGDPGVLYLNGYPVDEDGNIVLPTVGKLKMAGLTLDQAQALVQQQVNRYVRDANVLVKLLSFRVTVLGEVRTPGRYFVYNSQATVLEALGLAGDLTEFGNRQNVKLVRQTEKGSEVVLLNLTDSALLRSPYYYMRPNDALYVEPMKARTSRGNLGNLGVIFAGISAAALIVSFFITRK